MKPEEHIRELFAQALERAPAERGRFLEEACRDEPELRLQVESLVRAHERAEASPQRPSQGSPPDATPARPDMGPGGTMMLSEAAFRPPMTDSQVHSFGDYELLGEIARGGMGIVFKARQLSRNRLVALKMMLAGRLATKTEVKRFHAEAEAAARLTHPNIVELYEAGVHEGQPFFSMQYIEGRNLAQMEAEEKTWCGAGREAAQLLAKVARAVQFAHERGILHRDLKPDNILIDAAGEPHISDFGVARRIGADSSLTMEGGVVGTPSFMAPEQAAGTTKNLGVAADIYSMGAILYFLLTGRPPFVAASALDILVQVLEGEVILPRVINPLVARDLERICLCCLKKSPGSRYATAAALAEDLERFVRDEPVRAQPPGWKTCLIHWMRRQTALVSRLVCLGLCVLIAQVKNHYQPSVPWAQHVRIVSVLLIWALLSVICQWALGRERWSQRVPYVWVTVDTVCLTAALWLDEAMPSPLMASFVVLVVMSGLWSRATLVALATGLAMLGYSFLLYDDFMRHQQQFDHHLNRHIIFLVFLALTGFTVTYLVHRTQALSRFFDRRA